MPATRTGEQGISSLILTTLIACACSWYAVEMKKAARRRAVAARVWELGGSVQYYTPEKPDAGGRAAPWWALLRRIHGDKRLGLVVIVNLSDTRASDDDVRAITRLTTV